jgi:hypothetical protein
MKAPVFAARAPGVLVAGRIAGGELPRQRLRQACAGGLTGGKQSPAADERSAAQQQAHPTYGLATIQL